MIKKLFFKNTDNHDIMFSMYSPNKVTENTNLNPVKPKEVRELFVIVPDDTYEPEIKYLSEFMVIPGYKKLSNDFI